MNEQLQRTLYAAHMHLAQHAWEAGGIPRVHELLEHHRPKGKDTDLRGFEWHYLNRLSHAEIRIINAIKSTNLNSFGHVNSIAYSPDGKRLATGSGERFIRVWNCQTGQEVMSFQGHADDITCVTFSPDGERLASASFDKTVKVWNARTGQEIHSFQGYKSYVTKVAFSPDGKRLATVTGDTKDNTVKVWNAQDGQELLSFQGGRDAVTFSPDGKRLASGTTSQQGFGGGNPGTDDAQIRLWDAQTGQLVLSIKGNAHAVVFSPDGKRLASSSMKIWDAETGQELLTFKDSASVSVTGVAFSPDGKRLASGSWDKTVKVWDTQTGQELFTLKGHTNIIDSVAFSPDGTQIASAGDSTVRFWNADPAIFKAGRGGVGQLAFSPDGKIMATAPPGSQFKPEPADIKIFDVQSRREILTLKGHVGHINRLTFTADGKRLASSAASFKFPSEVKIWDA